MSAVAFGPRTAGKPTQTTGTPLVFSTAIMSSIFLLVEFDPAILAEIVRVPFAERAVFSGATIAGVSLSASSGACSASPSCRPALHRPSGLLVVFLGVCLLRPSFLSAFLSAAFMGRRLADRDAIVEAEHHHDGVRLLAGEDTLGGGDPVGRLALGLVADQAGHGLVLADHAHVGLFGEGILEAVGQPVRHGVAEHQHVASGGHRRASPAPARANSPRAGPAAALLLERGEEVAAKPAAATALLRHAMLRRAAGRGKAEREELRRRRSTIPSSIVTATATAISGPVR